MHIKILFLSLLAYPLCSFTMETQQVSKPDFVRVELKEREDDLSDNDWTETVNNIASKLQDIYLPDINTQSIEQFKKDMFAPNGFSLSNLRKALEKNFGMGHLGIIRTKLDGIDEAISQGKQHPILKNAKNITSIITASRDPHAYLFDSSQVTSTDIDNYLNSLKKMTIQLLKSKKGEVPLITIPTFQKEIVTLNDIKSMTQKIGRKYDYLILDLRGNSGGSLPRMFHFLSLLVGNNDPDILAITASGKIPNPKNNHLELENELNNATLLPFYEVPSPGYEIPLKKNITEDITFKKMIILVNEKTVSAGEMTAATLKSTLGSKVCILGKPCAGSFEHDSLKITMLPHDFVLFLPLSGEIFYSPKYRKLLTGYRLLPDIRYDDMDTIIDKALQIIDMPKPCPEEPSYERTVQQ